MRDSFNAFNAPAAQQEFVPAPEQQVVPAQAQQFAQGQEKLTAPFQAQHAAQPQEQEFQPVQEQHVEFDPLGWLNELPYNAAAQGFPVDPKIFGVDSSPHQDAVQNGQVVDSQAARNGNTNFGEDDLANQYTAENDLASDNQPAKIGNMNAGYTNEEVRMADQNLQAFIMAGEEHDLLAELLNIPEPGEVEALGTGDNNEEVVDDDLFGDEFVENRGTQVFDSQDTIGSKRKRNDDDQEEQCPAQRARLE